MKHRILILSFLAFLFCGSCSKIDFESINNLNGGRIDVIGHAGAGFQSLINPYPNNSLSSITYAVDGMNADGLELDFQITSDSILIAYHDAALERSTNCYGCVNQLPVAIAEKCQYYNQYGAQVAKDAYLIRLTTILDHFKNYNRKPKIYLNLKIDDHCTDMSNPLYKDLWAYVVAHAIADYNAYQWVYVYDGDPDLLTRIHSLDPQIEIIYNAQTFDGVIDLCKTNSIKAIVIGNDDITKEQVAEAHANGIKIILWDLILRKDIVDAINKSPDGLMTDNIPLTQECLQN